MRQAPRIDYLLNEVEPNDIPFPPRDMRSCEGWPNSYTCSRPRAAGGQYARDAAAGGEVASECDARLAEGGAVEP